MGTYTLIKGNEISAEIYPDIKKRVLNLKAKGITPGLGVILVGDDPASKACVKMKERKCKELGIESVTVKLPMNVTEEYLLQKVDEFNKSTLVHGFLIQLPLPEHINENHIIDAIDPKKDVDCFHPENVGRLFVGNPIFLPATPAGVQQLLVRSNIKTTGKHVVIVGRSNIVGKPMAAIMMQKGIGADSTVTVTHSKTKNLSDITRQADILIVAVGKAHTITADMVKEGATVIDVGINRVSDNDLAYPGCSRLVGDVDFDNVKDKTSAISPVPGGVGPMTICMLMRNTVIAAEHALRNQI
ncbi:MAG: bifunctional 5,10-methylene-tetrahydrofolate dehydrogenase/5,10-methylene-tetrahydrofolate cyclohydrolase [archaeon]|nr:bifunctional 5,10-methylene-tetrahydrofolate dehydrogenase/5,10-methylene-tetrahydrofolate cyclohydrolase [archaeon]